MSDIGESLVGAYLRYVRECDIVVFNQRTARQGEIDVVGIKGGAEPQVWLCEVATHILGLGYGSFDETTQKLQQKVDRAFQFADDVVPEHLPHFELWAPYVPTGRMTDWMEVFAGRQAQGHRRDVDFMINQRYTEAVQALTEIAARVSGPTSEPAFRFLQILTHLRGDFTLRQGPSTIAQRGTNSRTGASGNAALDQPPQAP